MERLETIHALNEYCWKKCPNTVSRQRPFRRMMHPSVGCCAA